MANKNEPALGPYTSTTTKTIKVSGPIEFTVTTKVESTHVPTAPCGCGGGALGIADFLAGLAQSMPGVASAFTGSPTPTPDGDGHAH